MGGNRDNFSGINGNWNIFKDFPRSGIAMRMKSWEWEGMGSLQENHSRTSLMLTVAGIPSPAAAHFLIHCCRLSIPFCSMPFAMLAPSVT